MEYIDLWTLWMSWLVCRTDAHLEQWRIQKSKIKIIFTCLNGGLLKSSCFQIISTLYLNFPFKVPHHHLISSPSCLKNYPCTYVQIMSHQFNTVEKQIGLRFLMVHWLNSLWQIMYADEHLDLVERFASGWCGR